MGRLVVLDPTAPPAAGDTWVAPRLDRGLRGLTIGLRLDRSWRCYEIVLDAWEQLLHADGASVERLVVDARVSGAGEQMRSDLAAWSHLVDCAVVGLGN